MRTALEGWWLSKLVGFWPSITQRLWLISSPQALVLAVHGDHFRDIRLATCGVIFLGTPHQGSSAAEYDVGLARAIRSDTTLLETLKKDSPTLYGLAQDFELSYKYADIVCFYEDEDSLGGIQVCLHLAFHS